MEIVHSKVVKTHAQAEMIVSPCNPPDPLARALCPLAISLGEEGGGEQ